MVSEIVHMELHGLRPEAHGSSCFLNWVRLNIIQVQFNSCSSLQKSSVTWLLQSTLLWRHILILHSLVFFRKDYEKPTCKVMTVIIGADLQQNVKEAKTDFRFHALDNRSWPRAQSGFLGFPWLIHSFTLRCTYIMNYTSCILEESCRGSNPSSKGWHLYLWNSQMSVTGEDEFWSRGIFENRYSLVTKLLLRSSCVARSCKPSAVGQDQAHLCCMDIFLDALTFELLISLFSEGLVLFHLKGKRGHKYWGILWHCPKHRLEAKEK